MHILAKVGSAAGCGVVLHSDVSTTSNITRIHCLNLEYKLSSFVIGELQDLIRNILSLFRGLGVNVYVLFSNFHKGYSCRLRVYQLRVL
jgi:hypothetical protein